MVIDKELALLIRELAQTPLHEEILGRSLTVYQREANKLIETARRFECLIRGSK